MLTDVSSSQKIHDEFAEGIVPMIFEKSSHNSREVSPGLQAARQCEKALMGEAHDDHSEDAVRRKLACESQRRFLENANPRSYAMPYRDFSKQKISALRVHSPITFVENATKMEICGRFLEI